MLARACGFDSHPRHHTAMTIIFREVDRDKFEALVNGSKSIETRAATPKYRNVKVGDVLAFRCGKDQVSKTVKSVRLYKGVKDIDYTYDLILPGAKTTDDLLQMYKSFPGYSHKIEQFGLVAWELEDPEL